MKILWENDNNKIRGADIEGIVDYLIITNYCSDLTLIDNFFATFPYFAPAAKVWEIVSNHMKNIPSDEMKNELPTSVFGYTYVSENSNATLTTKELSSSTGFPVPRQKPHSVRESLFVFLYEWIQHSFYRDFLQTKQRQDVLFDGFLNLLRSTNSDIANRFKLLMIKSAYERKRRARLVKLRPGATTPPRSNSAVDLQARPAGLSIAPITRAMSDTPGVLANQARKAPLEPGKFDFVDLDAAEVAQQLTYIEFEIFREIQESEFYHLSWRSDKPKRLIRSPHIVKLVDRFNNVSFWVATEIVMATDLKRRIAVLKKFIEVANHLRDMNNFNGVMELIGGLNMYAVSRLKQTWEAIPKVAVTSLEELNLLMGTAGNYKNYRAALKNVKLPVLPYLGVVLRDLTFIEENQDWIDEKESGVFNFDKLQMLGQVINDVKKFQFTDYTLERNDVLYDYLWKLQTLPDEMLHRHSTLCEPVNRDSNQ